MQSYGKTLALILAGTLSVNGITALAAESKGTNREVQDLQVKTSKIIKKFTVLGSDISQQSVEVGTTKQQLNLPKTLEAETSVDTLEEQTTSEAINVSTIEEVDVTWEEVMPYDGDQEGIYEFKAVIPESYKLDEGISLPSIVVTVKENKETNDFKIASVSYTLQDSYKINAQQNLSKSVLYSLRKNSQFIGINYGEQLTENQKKIYDAFTQITPETKQVEVSMVIEVESEVELSENGGFKTQEDADEFSKAYATAIANEDLTQSPMNALVRDYPKICWLKFGTDGCKASIQPNSTTISQTENGMYEVETTVICTTPVADKYKEIDGFLEEMQAEINSVVENINENDTTYDKLKAFHDYLCNNVTYNLDATYGHEAYGTFIKGEGVCEGYAEAFKLLCDAADIPCVLVTGMGVTSEGEEPHMWNYVQMPDKNWYAVDVTWDDQESKIIYDYFLVGLGSISDGQTFEDTHIANGQFVSGGKEFTYPTLASKAYNTEKEEGPEAPTVEIDTESNSIKITDAIVDARYEVLVDDVKIYDAVAEEKILEIKVNELIEKLPDSYVIEPEMLAIRVAETTTTNPGKSWVNAENSFKYMPEFVDSVIPAEAIKGTTIPLTLIVDVPSTWEEHPSGVIGGTYIIKDSKGNELSRANLEGDGEWKEYVDQDEDYAYNGYWCYETEIAVPNTYVGTGVVSIEPTLEEDDNYNGAASLTQAMDMDFAILDKVGVNITINTPEVQNNEIIYGDALHTEAVLSLDSDVYGAEIEGKVQFSLDGTIVGTANISEDEEGNYVADYTWDKLECKKENDVYGSYTITAEYIPADTNTTTKVSTSNDLAIKVNPKTLTPGVNITGVQSKVYDGTTDLKETDIPTIILSGAVGEDKPSATADYAFAEKVVGNQKINATNITLDSKNDINKNYMLLAHTAMSTNSIQITAAKPNIYWGSSSKSWTYTGNIPDIPTPVVELVNNEKYADIYGGNNKWIYAYRKSETNTWQDGLPVDAGTYEIKAGLAATGNYKEAESNNYLTLTIQKGSCNRPSAPTLKSINDAKTQIVVMPPTTYKDQEETISEKEILEYSIQEVGKETRSEWQTSTTFDNLTVGATYGIYARIKESSNYTASAESQPLYVTLKRELLDEPSISGQLIYGETLTIDKTEFVGDGKYEYSWYREGEIKPIAKGESYTLGAEDIGKRITLKIVATAESDYTGEREVTSEKVEKANCAHTPIAPILESRTSNSITIKAANEEEKNLEYRIEKVSTVDNNTNTNVQAQQWQEKMTFNGLEAGTDYVVYARIKESNICKPSAQSEASEIITTKKLLSGKLGIEGELKYGEILTANTEDLVCDDKYEIGWYREGTLIGKEKIYTIGREDIGKTISLKAVAQAESEYEGSVEVVSESVKKFGRLEIPTYVTMDDEKNTYTFKGTLGTTYEYSTDEFKTAKEIIASEGEMVISVGNEDIAVGQLKVRAKATELYDASESISNPEPFKKVIVQINSNTTSGGGGSSKDVVVINTTIKALKENLPSGIQATIVAAKLADELQNKVAQDEKLTILKDANLIMSLESKTISFEKPILVTLDLSNAVVKNPAQLTLVKYEQQQDGSIKVIKLGGEYNADTKAFKAYAEQTGIYDVVEDSALLKVNLTIGEKMSTVNGNEIMNDVSPEIIQGTTMVPLRFIAENLGADVKWNGRSKTVTITLEGKVITLKVNEGAILKEGRTLVPIRYISENLGAHVLWLSDSKEIQVVK